MATSLDNDPIWQFGYSIGQNLLGGKKRGDARDKRLAEEELNRKIVLQKILDEAEMARVKAREEAAGLRNREDNAAAMERLRADQLFRRQENAYGNALNAYTGAQENMLRNNIEREKISAQYGAASERAKLAERARATSEANALAQLVQEGILEDKEATGFLRQSDTPLGGYLRSSQTNAPDASSLKGRTFVLPHRQTQQNPPSPATVTPTPAEAPSVAAAPSNLSKAIADTRTNSPGGELFKLISEQILRQTPKPITR